MATKTITKTKKIYGMEDIKEKSNDDIDDETEYIQMMMLEIDELNIKLQLERNNNEKNNAYIEVLEEELEKLYKKYEKLSGDIKYLEDFKNVSKLSNEKIKNTIKAKLSSTNKDKYDKLPTDDLRNIANQRLQSLKEKLNINIK